MAGGGLPFDHGLDIPNLEALLAIDDASHIRNLGATFDSVEPLMDDLNS